MRKGQDRKVKIARSGSAWAGRAGCLGLLALGLALVNPVGMSVFAEEVEDYRIDTQTLTTSTVNIAFSPVAGTAVAPIGVPTKFQVTAKVDVQNSGGYTIYFGSNSQNLTRVGGTETIAPIAGNVSFDNLENDTWGYALAEGATVPDTATYTAVPGSVRGRAVYTNNSTKILSDSKTYTLSFAARIGTSKPAGAYQNEVTMSVVSSPAQLALSDISEMQQMTSDICENTAPNATKQLRDTRDETYYWVRKMPDNQCWMVQNLALDLGTTWPDASKSDYDIASTDYTPTPTQNIQETPDTSSTSTRSWNFGKWVINKPTVYSTCGAGLSDMSTCTTQFTNVAAKTPSTNPDFYKDNDNKTVIDDEYDAHYLVGNYYTWNTATAGTGGTITSGVASGSICPKNWKLPTSGDAKPGSFDNLVATLTGTDTTEMEQLTGDGYFFVRGGGVWADENLFNYAGDYGRYWPSTPGTSDHLARALSFNASNTIYPVSGYGRRSGLSVRCVAR